MEFNKELFGNLLEKAKGDRSINQYARDIDVSPAHISRLIRKLIDTPPSPDTILKFTSHAQNEISYNNLMQAAGYINYSSEISNDNHNNLSDNEKNNYDKKILQIILPYLYSLGKRFTFDNSPSEFGDLIIELEDEDVRNNSLHMKWYINFKVFSTLPSLMSYYGKLSLYNFSDVEMVSIIVSNKDQYKLILNHIPVSLKLNFYVILVDLENCQVIKNKQLCSF